MPTRGDTQINSFVKGLITEASPLSFPANASLDVLNFKLQKDGSNFRRLGIDFEPEYLLTATGYSSTILLSARKAFYRWQLPNGSTTVEIGVVQIGAKFWFLNLFAENPSAVILNGGVAIDAGVDVSSRFSFAVINNYLIVVSPNLPSPYLVSYNDVTDVISFETSLIEVRDQWGVEDNLEDAQRPSMISNAHLYNLRNQGWLNTVVSTCGAGVDAVQCTYNTFGVYPSNSDVWSLGRIGDLTSANVDKFDPNIAARNLQNTGYVARGHYIIPLINRGAARQALTGLTVPTDRETGAISCVASYAGRAFYAGILSKILGGDARSPILSGAVLFSQTFTRKIDLVRCYQEADPTSPDISDMIDTDGGIIVIPECAGITHLRPLRQSLFVFAVNGVWEILGGERGFTATEFQVRRVSNIGVYSPDSIVEVNGVILFWAIEGIFSIAPNQFGTYDSTNLTSNTIQKLYNSYSDSSRSQAKGYYDLNSNTVRWLYYSDDSKVVGQPIDAMPPVPTVVQLGTVTDVTSVSSFRIDVARMTDNLAMITYTDGTNNLRVRLLTITDVAVSVGSDQAPGIANALSVTSVCRLTDSKALVTYLTSANNIGCRVLSISAGTVTTGTEVTFACKAGATYKVEAFSDTQAIVSYLATTNRVAARVLDVAGTVITAGAQLEVSVNTTVTQNNIDVIDSTHAIASYLDSTGNFIRGRVIVRAGSVLTVPGSETNISAGITTSAPTEVKMLDSVRGVVTWVDAGSNIMKSVIISVSGTTITPGSTYSYTKTASAFSSQWLSGGKYVIGYNLTTTNLPYMLVNSVGTTPIEGINTQLASETSFEFSVDGMTSNKVIIIYKAFSSAIIKAFVATV